MTSSATGGPHAHGVRGSRTVRRARPDRGRRRAAHGAVIFTSGPTESTSPAMLGLAGGVDVPGHIVSSAIGHHAALGPIAELERRGFSVTLVPPDGNGLVSADRIVSALRPDTLLVSLMHVNNETGAVQPIEDVARELDGTAIYFHVDAAQSFAREIETLRHPRIDLISASAHKINGPKGIGALVVRRREGARPPLRPLMFGGGQERGLRPGTMPVALAVGFGVAAERTASDAADRRVRCARFRESLLAGLAPLNPVVNGDPRHSAPYIINLAFPRVVA